MRLTDLSIQKLPVPPKGQKTYFDDMLPSFGCRVSQGGTRSFVVQHGYDRQLITIGRYPTLTLAQARSEAKRILAHRTLGRFHPQSVAWDEAKALFIAACERKNRPSTVNDYKRLLTKHFPFGRTRLSDISPHDLHRRIDRLADTPSEQRHASVALKIFLNWAYRKNYIETNPADRMALHTRTAVRERVLTDAELAAIYRTALNREDNYASIVALLILTGQRRGEIGRLRWDWVDHTARTIQFPASVTKNKRAHTIPFGDVGAEIINRVPRLAGYVFPASRATWRDSKPTTTFNGWGKCKADFDEASGVADWTLHDLRRTFATNLAGLGIAPHVVERLLNHSSGTISGVAAIYNKFQYLDEMRAAVAAWEARLTSLLDRNAPAGS